MFSSLRWPAFVALALAAPLARGEEHELTFERDIRPIFKTHCFQCHGEGEKLKGDLDVRLRRFLIKPSESGQAVLEPGHPEKSELAAMVKEGEMPKKGKKLNEAEIAALEKWIAQGAKTMRPEPEKVPAFFITEEERSYWAFQPIAHPAPPKVKAAERVRTPIDAFILARLEAKGLAFSPEADRRTLIRRASFDLLGLPPTPAEVETFVADTRTDAYEQMIDRLLASPQYGERWGRHWLDVAGYADSEGYNDADAVREDAYRYRDYVIRAFNSNKPFDQFIREQLAGDEMAPPPGPNLTPDQIEKLTATGFLRMVPDGTAVSSTDEVPKNAVLTETVKVVSTALLGLTVGCAECHDHRYDPIAQRDFYKLRAILEPAFGQGAGWRVPAGRAISLLTPEQKAEFDKITLEANKIDAELQPYLESLRDEIFEKELAVIPEELRGAGRAAWEIYVKDAKKLSPEQLKLLEDYPRLKVAASAGILNLFLTKYNRQEELAKKQEEIAKRSAAVRARRPKVEYIRALAEQPGAIPVTHLFKRGDYTQPGEEVKPADLCILGEREFPMKDPALPTTGRRLAFAKYLTSGEHPLTPRVLVNRFWMHHFGRGLVGTPGDFGKQGEKPSHPELLDWLASDFVKNGWDLKKFHRQVMTSSVYRQSSRPDAKGNAVDAGNELLWHMPVRRLEAETIRDAILAITGKLNPAQFGEPVAVTVDENQQVIVGDGKAGSEGKENRRSIYVQMRRSQPAYLLNVFDEPDMQPNCEIRTASTVAPQSLMLMNSRFIVEQAEQFAARVKREAGDDLCGQILHAWRLAYGSSPKEAELMQMLAYLKKQSDTLAKRAAEKKDAKIDPKTQALSSYCQVLLASNRLLYVD
jgi:hypothetical protein